MINIIKTLGLSLLLALSCTSCSIVKNIEDITDNANQILEELADLSRTVNSAVETGELEESVGQLVDGRIEKLSDSINDILQEGGGFVFDEVNGTLDNTFDNVRSVIDDIKTGILDESLPRNIELLSQQLVLNTNNIASHVESLVNLTFGNTAIVISQATDAAFTLSVWGIFGVGLVLFILFLIIWGSKMSALIRNVVFGMMATFLGVCMLTLFVTPVKARVLSTLNVGEQMVARALEPKILSALPLDFELGSNDRLTLFGTHLDSIDRDTMEIALYQSNNKKLTFPKSTIKVVTTNKIILSDFDKSSLSWSRLTFPKLSKQYRTLTNKALPSNYEPVSKSLTTKKLMMNPVILKSLQGPSGATRSMTTNPSISRAISGTHAGSATGVAPRNATVQPFMALSGANTTLNTSALVGRFALNKELSRAISTNFSKDYAKIALQNFKIAPGDYELRVVNKESGEAYNSVQHVEFSNPPPPPPKPDVFPISLNWAAGAPVKGEKAKLSVLLGVVHGEQAKNNMDIDLTANPSLSGLRDIRVNRSVLNSARQTVQVQSKEFTASRAGNVNFTARSDVNNKIAESNESNNVKSQRLRIRNYHFKATLKFTTFTSTADLDDNTFCGQEEYRVDIDSTVTGHSGWHIDYNKDGKANVNYNVSKTKTYSNLQAGDKINIFTSGYEKGDCLEGDQSMGSASKTFTIQNRDAHTHEIQLRAKHYILRGELKYEKVVLN